jgi:hypothetical protein
MVEVRKTARIWFAAALTLYLLWVAALAVLAAVSASRPAANKPAEKRLTMSFYAHTICDEPLGRSKQTTNVPPSRCTVPDLS